MGRHRVLLVGQDARYVGPLAEGLRARGISALAHTQEDGALAVILRERPELLVLETDRPRSNAQEMIQKLKRNPLLASIPVLLLAPHLEPAQARSKTVRCGAQGFLSGTMDPEAAVAQIDDLLARRLPHLPADEGPRLAELHKLKILDTGPEAAFDELVRVASLVCGTPMAVVSLVDAERQWFKARLGIEGTETQREVAFCAHAIHSPEVLEVPDATADTRFARNPLVTGHPDIRFYAGAPIITSSGHSLGTLCVIDRIPRTLTAEQRTILISLSRVARALLELRNARG
ncbi:MAG: GAF domain-containing protein [Polyangia bacterium]